MSPLLYLRLQLHERIDLHRIIHMWMLLCMLAINFNVGVWGHDSAGNLEK